MSTNVSSFLQSRVTAIHQHGTKLESKQEDNTSIATLIKSEIRPFRIGWIEFACNKDDTATIKAFKEAIIQSLSLVQNGLYVLLKLPQPIPLYSSAQDIINILIKLYQIIDNAASKTHGLAFDSRIIIIYSKDMYNALTSNPYFSTLPRIDQYSTAITFTDDKTDHHNASSCFNKYKKVVFGGTFDHLHSGHKVLITIACLSSLDALYIGLSIDQLLVKKKFANMLQSFDQRKHVLLDFIQCIKPGLNVIIEPLNDIFGPSVYESIEALVISKETEKGGAAVNAKRKEMNRNVLELIVIDFIISNSTEKDANEIVKVSSTEIRRFDERYQYLYQQWKRLMAQLIPKQIQQPVEDADESKDDKNDVRTECIDEWWYVLCNFYQQKQRFYHDLDHIHHLIENCIKYSKHLDNVTVVLLAIWFHDIVYDATKHDNERMSIGVFEVFVEHLLNVFGDCVDDGLTKDMIEKVVCYIDATIKHQIKEECETDNDLKWFLDFDLAILGEESDIYETYAKNIRKEYIHVQSPMYEQKRGCVMQTFLDRKQLYFTNVFQQNFEKIARENVLNEIQTLQNLHEMMT
eukprot:327653_1